MWYSLEPVPEELLRDVALAVGVLEGQVELVVLGQHVPAVLRLRARAAVRAAASIDVHIDVSTQLRTLQQKNFTNQFSKWGIPLKTEKEGAVDRLFEDDICLHWYTSLSEMRGYYQQHYESTVASTS